MKMNVPLRNRKGSFARNLLEQNPDLWYSLHTLSLAGTWLFEIAWEVVNKGGLKFDFGPLFITLQI